MVLSNSRVKADVLGSSPGSGSYCNLQKVPSFLASLSSSLPRWVQGKEAAPGSSQVLLALAVQDCTTIGAGMEIKHGQRSETRVLLRLGGKTAFVLRPFSRQLGLGWG